MQDSISLNINRESFSALGARLNNKSVALFTDLSVA